MGLSWKPYPVYKDSGVEWLGEIPEGWGTKRLKYLSTVNDETLGETTNTDFEILYVDISSVDSVEGIQKKEPMIFENAPSRARRRVRHGDVIISTVRTYLKAIAPIVNPEPNLIVSTGFAVVRPKEELTSQFASYALRSLYFVDRVVANSVGVSYPAINASELISFPIIHPSLPEQRAIATFLDRETTHIDQLMAKKERQKELLQEKRAALISHAVTKGLDPIVKMKDSGVGWLGEIPEEWDILPIKRIVEIPVTDGPHETPDLLDTGIPFISAEAIKNDIIDFSKKRGYISIEEHLRFSKKYKPKRNDIYIIKSGATTGNVAMVETDEEFNIWSPLAAIRVDPKKSYYRFIFHFLKSNNFFQSVELGWSYGTQQNIGMNVIENLVTTVPPLPEQHAIAAFLDKETGRIDTLITKVNTSIETLHEYRTALISAAVTGKIDVREEVKT